jgi:hypothetical protein
LALKQTVSRELMLSGIDFALFWGASFRVGRLLTLKTLQMLAILNQIECQLMVLYQTPSPLWVYHSLDSSKILYKI